MIKVYPSVRPICDRCRVVRHHGRAMMICENPRHE